MRDITVAGAKGRVDKYTKWKVGDTILGFFLSSALDPDLHPLNPQHFGYGSGSKGQNTNQNLLKFLLSQNLNCLLLPNY